MQIAYATTWLADGVHTHASGLSVSGRRVVQQAKRLRAATAQFWDRGNASAQISFRVSPAWSTHSNAELVLLTLWADLPGSGDLVFHTSVTGETVTYPDAVISSANLSQEGLRLPIDLTFSVGTAYTTSATSIPLLPGNT